MFFEKNSFNLAKGKYEAHIQVYDDGGSQTSGTLKAGLDLFVVPEYVLGGLLALGACFAAFAAFKKLPTTIPRRI